MKLSPFLNAPRHRGRDKRHGRFRPTLLRLEDRTVLSPTVFTVTGIGDSVSDPQTATSGDLRYCVGLANANTSNSAGSLIQFSPSVFDVPQTILLSPTLGTLALTESAASEVIDGPGANLVTVSGGNAVGVFSVASGVTATLTGLTISGGLATVGGGIDNAGTLTVTNSAVTNDSATITGSVGSAGGGIENESGATLTVTGSTITNNSANSYGGGIGSFGGGTVTITDCTIAHNTGSGIFIYGGSGATITDCTIEHNSTTDAGGGIYNLSALTVVNSTIADNSVAAFDAYGGGIENSGGLTVTNSTIAGNSVTGSSAIGGGILNEGSLTVIDSTVASNTASGGVGGGLYNSGTMSVTSSTIAYNSAASGIGGGIFNSNPVPLTLTDSTIANNSAMVGGGIYNDGTLTAINDSIVGNAASGGSYLIGGGGILADAGYPNAPAILVATNDTIAYNNSGSGWGGGLDIASIQLSPSAQTILSNTIVAENTGQGDIAVNGNFNLLGATNDLVGVDDIGSLTNGVNGNIVGVNPLLAPNSGSYGGPTQTLPLLPGSPAIDAGSNALIPFGITTDQRGTGFPRIVGGTVDIGAFESSGFTLSIAAGNNQSTTLGTAFPIALQVTVTPNNAGDPVNGGVVTFTPPASGASATLSPAAAVTITSGAASVTAMANGIAGGPYDVTGTVAGASPLSFSLSNVSSYPQLAGPWFINGNQVTQIQQNGASLTFINEQGNSSPGSFLNANQVVATGWGNLIGTLVPTADGIQIAWANGTNWDQLQLAGQGVIGSEGIQIDQNGNSLTFINEFGGTSPGYIADVNHVVATAWGNLVGTLTATFDGFRISWANGTFWDMLRLGGTWFIDGSQSTEVLQPGNGNSLTFINEFGASSAGQIQDADHVVATGWGNLVGTLVATAQGVEIDWSNGTSWDELRPGG